MSLSQDLAKQLESTKKYFHTTISVFDAADAGFAPSPELYTVAGHIAHTADSIDWFIEGAFGKGWNLDFDASIAKAKAVTSLSEAIAWLDRAFANAIAVVGGASEDVLLGPITDTRVMAGPRASMISGIVDHTAHHRGALAVYARLVGKQPPMPYA